MIVYVFLIPTPFNLILAAFAAGLVLMFVGTYLGLKTGVKINSLIN